MSQLQHSRSPQNGALEARRVRIVLATFSRMVKKMWYGERGRLSPPVSKWPILRGLGALQLALIAILITLDFLSKAIAVRQLTAGGITVIKNFFSLDLVFNSGIAWGFFDGHAGLWFGIRLVLIVGLIYYFWRHASGWEGVFLSLVLAGALGNTIDYILYGRVVDFLHFTFWRYSFPIFNIADSCVTLGAIGLILWPTKHHNG